MVALGIAIVAALGVLNRVPGSAELLVFLLAVNVAGAYLTPERIGNHLRHRVGTTRPGLPTTFSVAILVPFDPAPWVAQVDGSWTTEGQRVVASAVDLDGVRTGWNSVVVYEDSLDELANTSFECSQVIVIRRLIRPGEAGLRTGVSTREQLQKKAAWVLKSTAVAMTSVSVADDLFEVLDGLGIDRAAPRPQDVQRARTTLLIAAGIAAVLLYVVVGRSS